MATYRIQWQGRSGAWLFLDRAQNGRSKAFETHNARLVTAEAQKTASDYGRPSRVVARVDDKGRWQDDNMILGAWRCDPR